MWRIVFYYYYYFIFYFGSVIIHLKNGYFFLFVIFRYLAMKISS